MISALEVFKTVRDNHFITARLICIIREKKIDQNVTSSTRIDRYIIYIRGSKTISHPNKVKKKERLVNTITGNSNMYVYLFN